MYTHKRKSAANDFKAVKIYQFKYILHYKITNTIVCRKISSHASEKNIYFRVFAHFSKILIFAKKSNFNNKMLFSHTITMYFVA